MAIEPIPKIGIESIGAALSEEALPPNQSTKSWEASE